MHQTFYIDVDEEITSIINRLRKSRAKENIFVLPRGALILQSIVNLKLLKKETEKLKKQLMIVTQDAQGRGIAEKVGIFTQPTLEGLEGGEEIKDSLVPVLINKENINIAKKDKKIPKNIGSDSFYETESREDYTETIEVAEQEKKPKTADSGSEKIILENFEKEKVRPKDEKQKRGVFLLDIFRKTPPEKPLAKKDFAGMPEEKGSRRKKMKKDTEEIKRRNDKWEKEVSDLFVGNDDSKKEIPGKASIKVGRKVKKTLIFFAFFCVVAISSVIIFLFLPEVSVKLTGITKVNNMEFEVKGDVNRVGYDYGAKSISARLLEGEIEKEMNFAATGKSEISEQKARGKITIYNEFSSSSQPLVATTRFETPDGKIFRLINGVAIPGTTSVGGEIKPGVIETEVIADRAGEEYNISSATLKIPAFKGSAKYDKFYAKSSASMKGGGTAGKELKIVSQSDIDSAKKILEQGLKNDLTESFKNKMKKEEVLLEESVETEIKRISSQEAGVAAENFTLKMEMGAKAIVFDEKNLKAIVLEMEKNKGNFTDDARLFDVFLDYGHPTANFTEKIIEIKVNAKAVYHVKIDSEKLRNELIGKNRADCEDLIRKNYPNIKNFEAQFSPDFFPARFPLFKNNIRMQVEYNNENL